MPAPQNKLKAALARRELQIGIWLGLCSPAVAEMAGAAGYDWCLIDGEHGPNDLPLMVAQLRGLEGRGASAVVRVPQGEDWILKQVLDIGAQSVLVPMVETAAQARQVVEACKYAPQGRRGVGYALARASGYNAIEDYAKTANDQICVMVQVETRTAMANISQIAQVPGIDCIFIGPADLSADMGHLGDLNHPEVREVIAQGMSDIKAAGLCSGTICFDQDDQQRFIAQGGSFLGVAADVVTLQSALAQNVAAARKL
ncbi:HpcH/HpaI aldolase/citrate lyase family protein [uncultured Planktomarina sp.]|jgi:4-hydroxy-2-oxoheptanedioate aldolase|uniref:HpcH/HpaI aldolase family protein n=1 Tax=uncultured Planktomarina sp. TaxID=1538529 RepID=UPI0032614F15